MFWIFIFINHSYLVIYRFCSVFFFFGTSLFTIFRLVGFKNIFISLALFVFLSPITSIWFVFVADDDDAETFVCAIEKFVHCFDSKIKWNEIDEENRQNKIIIFITNHCRIFQKIWIIIIKQHYCLRSIVLGDFNFSNKYQLYKILVCYLWIQWMQFFFSRVIPISNRFGYIKVKTVEMSLVNFQWDFSIAVDTHDAPFYNELNFINNSWPFESI